MPKTKTAGKPKPLYRTQPATDRTAPRRSRTGHQPDPSIPDLAHATPLAPAHFILRDDGTIGARSSSSASAQPDAIPSSEAGASRSSPSTPPRLLYQADTPFVRLYHGNSLELLDALATKYPEGRFDCIFADPPYFLSNGGITCHAGRMVKADKLGAKEG